MSRVCDQCKCWWCGEIIEFEYDAVSTDVQIVNCPQCGAGHILVRISKLFSEDDLASEFPFLDASKLMQENPWVLTAVWSPPISGEDNSEN